MVPGGAVAGDALVRHPGVDKIRFTGGTATARQVMAAAAETLTPLAFELGGKSANIVFPDADLDARVRRRRPCSASVLLSGQGCALPTRLYVHDDVYDEVVERLVAQVEAVAVGDPLDPRRRDGPGRHRAGVRADPRRDRPRRGRRRGHAAHRRGAARRRRSPAATSSRPTVFGDVDQASDLARNEIFGPVLSLLRFRDEDEVVAKANDSDVRPRRLPAHRATSRRAHRAGAPRSRSARSP